MPDPTVAGTASVVASDFDSMLDNATVVAGTVGFVEPNAVKLKVGRDVLGGIYAQLSAGRSVVAALSARQSADLSLGLALLEAAVRPDEAFFDGDPMSRALEVWAAHELADAVPAADFQPSIEED